MKKTISLILCLAVLVSTFSFCMPMFAVELDAYTESVTNVQATAGLMNSAAVNPGLNVLTGTSEAYTFDNLDAISTEAGSVSVVTDPVGTDNVLALTGASTFSHNGSAYDIASDRPVSLSFDYYVDTKEDICFTVQFNEFGSRSAQKYTIDHIDFSAGTAKEWNVYSKVLTADEGKDAYTDDSCDLSLRPNSTNLSTLNKLGLAVATKSAGDFTVYIDNLKLVPYYKVTYDANGAEGTVDAEYTLNSVYIPENDGSTLTKEGYLFRGWSTTVDGEAVDSVTFTAGSDITLYAVWANEADIEDETINTAISLTAPVTGATPETTLTGAGYTATVEWLPAVEDAFLPATAYSAIVTITPERFYTTEGVAENGYTVAGADLVTNDANSNIAFVRFPATAPKQVAVSTSKAGLNVNLWTGTTEAFTFDSNANIQLSTTLTGSPTDPSNSVLQLPGWNKVGHKTGAFGIEADRPVDFEFKFYAETGSGALQVILNNVIDQMLPNVVAYFVSSPKNTWNTYTKTIIPKEPYSHENQAAWAGGDDAVLNNIFVRQWGTGGNIYLDDLYLTPYYKVTYDANGGEGNVPESVYFLDETFTPDTRSAEDLGLANGDLIFMGWATSAGGGAQDVIVPTPGEDLTLYAVWAEENRDITVSFAGDIMGIDALTLKEGDTLDLSEYLEVAVSEEASAAGKRFNGWTLTGDAKDIELGEITITDEDGDANFVITAVVNNDFNFAIPANVALFEAVDGTVEAGESGKTLKVTGTAIKTASGYAINGNGVGAIEVYYNNNLTVAGNETSFDKLTTVNGVAVNGGEWIKPDALAKWNELGYGLNFPVVNEGTDYYSVVSVNKNSATNFAEIATNITELKIGVADEESTFEIRYIRFAGKEDELVSTQITLAAPVAGEEPQTTVSGRGYTGEVIWTPAVEGTFAYDTEYIATIKITPDEFFTVNGIGENEFEVATAATVTNRKNSGDVTAIFPKTEIEIVTIDPNLALDAPAAGIAPMTSISGTGYTATVEWSPAIEDNKFAKTTVYTATITITTEQYFKTEGIAENGYVLPGAETVTSAADGNVVTVVYPATTDKDALVVTFADNTGYLAGVPANSAVAEGGILRLNAFYDVQLTGAALSEGLRFNGWSTTGEAKDIIDELIGGTEPVTLYAVVNHDINLAIPANRDLWITHDATRQTLSVGQNGRTLRVNGLSTYTRATTQPGVFNLDSNKYAGMVVYFAEEYEQGGAAKKFSEKTDSYVSYVQSSTAPSWTSDSSVFSTDIISGDAFKDYLDLIEDEEGNVIYTGIPLTYETSSRMADYWKGNITRLAICHGYTTSSFEIRYIRFVEPTEYEGTVEVEYPQPLAAEAPGEATVNAGATVKATTEQEFVEFELDGVDYTLYSGNTPYTYNFVVAAKADSNDRFPADVPVTINGVEVTDAVVSENGREITFSYTFPATESLDGFEIEVVGPTYITRSGRAAQYTANIIGETKSDVVFWSVSDITLADIDEKTGYLLPIRDGEVTVRATSPYNAEIYGEIVVTISNQTLYSQITYDLTGGTYGANGIEPTIGGTTVILTDKVPTREGYEFIGWALNDETNTTVTTINPTVDEIPETAEVIDVTVYAVWQKLAARFEFNGTDEGFQGMNNGSNCWYRVHDTFFEIQSGSNWDVRISKNGLNINPKYVKNCEIRYASTAEGYTAELYFMPDYAYISGSNSAISPAGTSLGLDDWRVMTITVTDPDWAAATAITGIALDPFNYSNGWFYVDYMRFIDDSRVVTFDTNLNGVAVTGMPETTTLLNGEVLTISEVPTAPGYKFVGWGKNPDATTGIKNTFTIVNDRTLYAIWTPVVEAENNVVELGNVDTAEKPVILIEGEPGTQVVITAIINDVAEDAGLFGTEVVIDEVVIGSNGTVAVDISEYEGVLEDVVVTAVEGTVTLAAATTAEIAEQLTKEEVKDEGDVEINIGSSQTNTTETRYPTKVENLTTAGTIDPGKIKAEQEAAEEEAEQEEAGETKFEGYPVVNTEAPKFEDVTSDKWFFAEVQTAYMLGLVQGRNEETFDPQGNITIAEAITLAVRLNYIYNGKELPEVAEGAQWYTPFVNAAIRAGIIKNNQFADYNVPALRKQVAAIMANALPSKYLTAINMFTKLPDVNANSAEFAAIIKLYNAGVLMGSDEIYSFLPETNITRAEMAAIVNRLAVPENRKRVVTDEEIEAKKMKFYAEDLATFCVISNGTSPMVRDDIFYTTSTAADINFYLTQGFGGKLDGTQVKTIVVALKWDPAQANVDLPQIYYTTPDGGWSGDRMIFGHPGITTANGAVEFTFDCTSAPEFASVITGLRFDPCDKKDAEFGIEYVIIG